MGQDLTGKLISATYEDLVQISGSILTDGLGVDITSIDVTASNAVNALSANSASVATSASFADTSISSSFATTASFALNAGAIDSGSFMITGSVSSNTLTFEKGDGSTFNLTVDTGSAVTTDTGSLMVTGSATNNVLTFTKGDGSTFSLTVDTGSAATVDTGSLLVTASISDATITFTKGDATTFDITVNNVSNAVSASHAVIADSALTATSASHAISSSYSLTATSASHALASDTAISASHAIFADTAGFATDVNALYTASVSDATISFLKGGGGTFPITINNVTNAVSASYAATASFLPSDTNLNITSISASTAVFQSASIGYLQTVTGSATIIGDAFILLNTNDAQRYAGLLVEDSGSSPTNYTASFFYDSQLNDWNYEYTTTASTDYGVALFGPEYNTKGSPIYLTANRIPKAEGTHHLVDTNISDNGTTVSINSNTQVTGSLNVSTNITAESLNVTSGTGSFTGSFSGVFDGISAGQIATGTGTVNTIAKWNTTSSLTDSSITDDGSIVKIAVNTVVTGSIINNNVGFTSTTFTSGSSIADAATNEVLFTIDATVYESLAMEYVIFDSTRANKRAGTFRSTWDDNTSAVVFDETTTTDIGNTSEFTLDASNNGTGTISVRATNNVGSAMTIIYERKLLG